jgi:hypothetical protein
MLIFYSCHVFVILIYLKNSDSTRMSKRAFNHLYGWGPRLRLRRPASILVIKCTTLLTCIENSYYYLPLVSSSDATVIQQYNIIFY